jgi:large subunit ribosomal protein L15
MELNNLKPAKGSTHHDKRIGRGAGSGHGGTATRGHKGAQSRSGYSRKLGFEGGQMPLQRRLPKFGFTNLKRVEFKAINLSTLEELAAKKSLTEVTVDTLIAAGFISSNDKVKILGNDFEGARRQGACVLEERRGGHHGSRGQRRKTVSNLRTQKL